jgi:hypothetical protein
MKAPAKAAKETAVAMASAAAKADSAALASPTADSSVAA